MRSRQAIEAILFLPAMALLACIVFAAFALVILFGGLVMRITFTALHDTLGLWRPLAGALTVLVGAIVVPLSVKGVVHALVEGFAWLQGLRSRRRRALKA